MGGMSQSLRMVYMSMGFLNPHSTEKNWLLGGWGGGGGTGRAFGTLFAPSKFPRKTNFVGGFYGRYNTEHGSFHALRQGNIFF